MISAKLLGNCRCCYFQTPSVVHCMNATASAQSPKFLRNFYPQTHFANFCGYRASALAILRVTRKRSYTFGMINRGRLELATSPIERCSAFSTRNVFCSMFKIFFLQSDFCHFFPKFKFLVKVDVKNRFSGQFLFHFSPFYTVIIEKLQRALFFKIPWLTPTLTLSRSVSSNIHHVFLTLRMPVILRDNVFFLQSLRGHCTSNQNLACLLRYLKIINTFLKKKQNKYIKLSKKLQNDIILK